MIKAMLYLLLFQLIGQLISDLTQWPVPGTVIGFILLFFTLLARRRLLGELLPVTRPLLANMMLLFVPVAVGIIQEWPLLQSQGIKLILALLVSQVIGFAATAWTMALILKWQRRRRTIGRGT